MSDIPVDVQEGWDLGELDYQRGMDPRFLEGTSEFADAYMCGYCHAKHWHMAESFESDYEDEVDDFFEDYA